MRSYALFYLTIQKVLFLQGKASGSKTTGSKNLHAQSTNSGLTKMSSMTSALPDLASCSYLSENSTGTSSKKVSSGPSLVTVKSSHSGITHKSTTGKKSHR